MALLPYNRNHNTLELTEDTIHLWFACPDEIVEEGLLSAYESVLGDEEKVQWQRFFFPKHRQQYLVTRALVRTALSRYFDLEPKDWRFNINEYGKPEIANATGGLPLRFNLSHTDGLVMCAVVLAHDIGVDVEHRQRGNTSLAIAEHCFSRQETQDLRQLPPHQQPQRFLEYWTLKEAYIKAKGMGLSLPLDQFSFRLGDDGSAEIAFDSGLEDDPSHWQFWRLNPSENHIAALAVKPKKRQHFQLKASKVIPFKAYY